MVVNSNVVHYTFTDTFLQYTCLIVSVKWCEQMHIPCNKLCFSPLVQHHALTERFRHLVHIYETDQSPLRIARLNEALLSFFIPLTQQYATPTLPAPSKSKKFDVIKETVAFIQKHYNRKISLDEIAASVHYDKYALCKIFKKYTGQTIIGYLHQYRILKAADYLKEGYTVSETAILCGFENLSFFTKIYKRYKGAPPSHNQKS